MNKTNGNLHQITPVEIYRKTLSRQKELIKNNLYAQELEKKYNKFRFKSQENSKQKKVKKIQNFWPIHSVVFTQVLRCKLNSVLTSSTTPKALSKPGTRIGSRIQKSMNLTNRSKLFKYEDITFARLSRN